MSNELALRGDMIRTVADLMNISEMLVKSGMLPTSIKSKEAAATIILKGREIGMPMMESFSLINVIQGKPTISPQGMIALAQRSGQLEDLQIVGDEKQCTVTVKRKGRSPHTATFTIAEAQKIMTQEKGETIPLTQKYNWRQMPATMLQWRCVAKNLRVTFADIIGGMYPPEELGADVNEDGEMIDSVITVQPVPLQELTPTAPKLEWTEEMRDAYADGLGAEYKNLPQMKLQAGGVPIPSHQNSKVTRQSFFAFASEHGLNQEAAKIATAHSKDQDWNAAMVELKEVAAPVLAPA